MNTITTRRVRAGQPVGEGTTSAQRILASVPLQVIDTERLQDRRAIEHFGEASQRAVCPSGFCGFDPKCTDLQCPGHPVSNTTRSYPRTIEQTFGPGHRDNVCVPDDNAPMSLPERVVMGVSFAAACVLIVLHLAGLLP